MAVPEGTTRVVLRAVAAGKTGVGGIVWYDDIALHRDCADGPCTLEGAWQGTLHVGDGLRLILHVDRTDEGWSFTLDSVDQNAMGLPVVNLDLRNDEVGFDLASPRAAFTGQLTSAGRIEGEWRQGIPLALVFERLESDTPQPSRRRPQESQPPFPYLEEDVVFSFDPARVETTLTTDPRAADDGITLRGTITLPPGEGPHPAVLLITGSGGQDRDETLFDHKPFLVLADQLSRHGLAVLRVDDRGTGESTGDLATATTADLARDALAGFLYLQQRTDIDPHRVALLGHSEGGLIAPMVATTGSGVAAIVLMAGPAVTGEDILKLQQRLMLEAGGADPGRVAEQQAQHAEILALIRSDLSPKDLETRLRTIFDAAYDTMSSEEQAMGNSREAYVETAVQQTAIPWMRWFLQYDPEPTLRALTCPVLAVFGERDLQVDPGQNLPAMEAAFAASGHADATVVELPELNHLFQHCETGLLAEYATIEETLAPEYLDLVTRWLQERLAVP